MRHPKEKWKGVPVILTSNKLPSVMREPKQYMNEEDYKFRERDSTTIRHLCPGASKPKSKPPTKTASDSPTAPISWLSTCSTSATLWNQSLRKSTIMSALRSRIWW